MKSIQTLIRLNKKELDDMRLQLAGLRNQKDEMLNYSRIMSEELAAEQEFAAASPEMSITFDSYRKKINERQKNIKYAVKEIDKQIEYMTDLIAQKFTEIKKYEIILEQKILAKKKKELELENKTLDEVAMTQFLKEAD